MFKYLIYLLVIQYYYFLRPQNPANILFQFLYILFNIFYIAFYITSFDKTGDKVGTLSIINIILFFFSLYLSFLADLLSLLLFNYQRIYRFIRIISFILVILYIFIIIYYDFIYSLYIPGNLYLLIISYIAISVDILFIN